MSGADRWLVVGLGNPGPKYAGNRHNAGFMVVESLAARMGARFSSHRSRAELAEGRLVGTPVALVKPRSYMNLSGGPVAGVANYFKVDPARIVVVHDELDIPFGVLRCKRGGGAGGHNGLRSVSASLGTPEYVRVRFGIGRPPGRQDAADFVLTDFSSVERKELGVHVERAADAVETIIAKGLEAAQNLYHAA
ncbi:aminoacyl-tRNA hydrolase [Allonocardiopsis opalescens]|uniref:Peptidyl-tRNA hydrolase n=1 Tax=Allonocardiopsis opalescens TaxID=1144618 RepID=A0A2T0QD82_9ACTN|nr:aminoacyl-tRNA hydrolase [Allonocardiopsis opalescens]PRY01830.1 PTH1 family peptidyl-tRNA hydrolase [Allonocardiopsis opalescens]